MAEAGTRIFRVVLRDQPLVHRDIEIDSGKSLAKLAEAIVRASDFEFDHAFGFYPDTNGRAVMGGARPTTCSPTWTRRPARKASRKPELATPSGRSGRP